MNDDLTDDDVVERLTGSSDYDWNTEVRRYFVEAPEVEFIPELDYDWNDLDYEERAVEGEWETMRREEAL